MVEAANIEVVQWKTPDIKEGGMKNQVFKEEVQDHIEVGVGKREVALWMAQDPTELDLEEQVLVEVENIEFLWTALNIQEGGMKSQVLIKDALWVVHDPTEVGQVLVEVQNM